MKSILLLIPLILFGCSKPLPHWGEVPDFSMRDQVGQTLERSDLSGKVWVADFIYTGCGGTCPMLTQKMSEFQKGFSKDGDVRFVSFSVDPDNDTPERLAEYASRFSVDAGRWYFLTGKTADEVKRVVMEGFKLSLASRGPDAPEIFHSNKFVLVDRTSRIRGYYEVDSEGLRQLAKDLERLLKERGT